MHVPHVPKVQEGANVHYPAVPNMGISKAEAKIKHAGESADSLSQISPVRNRLPMKDYYATEKPISKKIKLLFKPKQKNSPSENIIIARVQMRILRQHVRDFRQLEAEAGTKSADVCFADRMRNQVELTPSALRILKKRKTEIIDRLRVLNSELAAIHANIVRGVPIITPATKARLQHLHEESQLLQDAHRILKMDTKKILQQRKGSTIGLKTKMLLTKRSVQKAMRLKGAKKEERTLSGQLKYTADNIGRLLPSDPKSSRKALSQLWVRHMKASLDEGSPKKTAKIFMDSSYAFLKKLQTHPFKDYKTAISYMDKMVAYRHEDIGKFIDSKFCFVTRKQKLDTTKYFLTVAQECFKQKDPKTADSILSALSVHIDQASAKDPARWKAVHKKSSHLQAHVAEALDQFHLPLSVQPKPQQTEVEEPKKPSPTKLTPQPPPPSLHELHSAQEIQSIREIEARFNKADAQLKALETLSLEEVTPQSIPAEQSQAIFDGHLQACNEALGIIATSLKSLPKTSATLSLHMQLEMSEWQRDEAVINMELRHVALLFAKLAPSKETLSECRVRLDKIAQALEGLSEKKDLDKYRSAFSLKDFKNKTYNDLVLAKQETEMLFALHAGKLALAGQPAVTQAQHETAPEVAPEIATTTPPTVQAIAPVKARAKTHAKVKLNAKKTAKMVPKQESSRSLMTRLTRRSSSTTLQSPLPSPSHQSPTKASPILTTSLPNSTLWSQNYLKTLNKFNTALQKAEIILKQLDKVKDKDIALKDCHSFIKEADSLLKLFPDNSDKFPFTKAQKLKLTEKFQELINLYYKVSLFTVDELEAILYTPPQKFHPATRYVPPKALPGVAEE